MKRLLALAVLVAAPALAQSNGWREIGNSWGEIQTLPGSSALPLPPGCTTGSVAVFLGSPVSLGCDAGIGYDAATDTLTTTILRPHYVNSTYGIDIYSNLGSVTFYNGIGTPDLGLARSAAGVLRVTDGGAAYGRIIVGDSQAVSGSSGRFSVGEGPPGYTQLKGFSEVQIYASNGRLVRAGGDASATPLTYTLAVGESGAGTDIAGGNGVIQSGAGTGAGAASTLEFKTPDAAGSGSGAQTQVTRLTLSQPYAYFYQTVSNSVTDSYSFGESTQLWRNIYISRATLGSKSKTFTNNTKTGFVEIAVPSSTIATGTIIYEILAKDATNTQAISGTLKFSAAANSSGTVTAATVADAYAPDNPCTSGTLTNTTTSTTGSNKLTIEFQPNSSLAATTLEIHWRIDSPGTQTITPL